MVVMGGGGVMNPKEYNIYCKFEATSRNGNDRDTNLSYGILCKLIS